MKYYIVDAFTDTRFKGNPAGVCVVTHWPDEGTMQLIAKEINLAETAFAKIDDDGDYGLRWFTPTCEVKLCGHATLAAAYVLFTEYNVPLKSLSFHTLSGELRVSIEKSVLVLDFPKQGEFTPFDSEDVKAAMNECKIEDCVKATDDVLVRLESAAAVRSLKPNMAAMEKIPCRGVIVTGQGEGKEYDFVSRFFAPRVGVPEDPVTGSAHCKLAPYWAAILKKTSLKAYQASSRGGTLLLDVKEERVILRGEAVVTAEGTLRLK